MSWRYQACQVTTRLYSVTSPSKSMPWRCPACQVGPRLYLIHSLSKLSVFRLCFAVDEQRQVCHGGVPHSTLEPDCIYYPPSVYPPFALCYFTCDEGYRPSEIQDIIVGYRNYRHDRRQYVICMDGLWITHLHGNSIGFNDVCLPEGMYIYIKYNTMQNSLLARTYTMLYQAICFEIGTKYSIKYTSQNIYKYK